MLLIALSCELEDFYAVVYTKENVAAKALADKISDLTPPTQSTFGRLLGRIEEGKGEAYATKIDVRCSDRNRVIAEKRILIATGGSATAEMAMKYSSFSLWLSRAWLAFMDESQQYGNYHEIAALAAIQQPALIVFVGDHRQTPGGLSKGRELQQQIGRSCSIDPSDFEPCIALAIICPLPDSPSLLLSCGRMRARIMTLTLRACSMLAKHHILESGLQQLPHNTCQLPWRASSVRKRSVISMLLAA